MTEYVKDDVMIGLWNRKVWRCWSIALVSLWMAIAVTACDPHQFKTQVAQVPQIVLTMLSNPKTFNPALSNEFPHIFLFTYHGLTREDGDGTIQPALAESWTFSEDNRRVVFQLRQGLKWSDGQPLTADDVVFTYNDVYLNEAIPTDTRDGLRIGKRGGLPQVRKLDRQRVEFILPEPFAPLLRSLRDAYILPAHVLRKAVATKNSEGQPTFLSTWRTDTPPSELVSNGPFQLESYAPNQRMILRRNPYYWRWQEQTQDLPYIERIVWQIVESTDTEILKFRSGDLDILGAFSTLRAEDFSLLKREEKRGNFQIVFGGPRASTLFVAFNLNQGKRQTGQPLVDPIKSRWFNTVAFRQAVSYAIDRRKMINNTYRGLAQPQTSPISVQSPYYISSDEGLKTYDYNPQKAKELLLGAGFRYRGSQLVDADNHPVRFVLMTNVENRTRVALGAQIKQDLSKIGIQVDFVPLTFNSLLDKLDDSLDWECYLLGFTGSVEPNEGFNIWNPDGASHSFNQKPQPPREPIVGRQVADWEQKIGQLYIQAAQELDEAKRKKLYAETQRLTQEYLPFIYLVNEQTMAAVRDRVKGVKYTALWGAYWNLYEQYVVD